MAFKDILKAVSPVAMLADKNPDMLRVLGVAGNFAANKLEDREERKRREAQAGMVPGQGGQTPMPMKKGGKVSSASKRADGCCIRGKTRA